MWSLVGDRFVRDAEGRAIDVGTGRRVWLEERRAEDGVSMRRWEESSANLMARWHSHLAPIVDAFAVAEDRFLVAHPYAPACPAAKAARQVRAVAESVAAFLRSQGLRAGEAIEARARLIDGVVKIQPGGDMGEEADVGAVEVGAGVGGAGRGGLRIVETSRGVEGAVAASGGRGVRIKRRPVKRKGGGVRAVGLRLVRNEAVEASVAAIECLRGGDVASLFIGAARGAGFSTFLAQMTREVRRLGIVPVHVRVWRQPELMAMLAGRTVALVADDEGEEAGRELRCAIAAWGASRSRLAAVIARVEPGHACTALSLPPMAVDDFVSRLWVSEALGAVRPRRSLIAMVRRAEGLPGRVIARLLPEQSTSTWAPDVFVAGDATGEGEEAASRGREPRVIGLDASWAAEAQVTRFSRTHRALRARGRGAGAVAVSGLGRLTSPVSARVRRRGEAVGVDPLSAGFGMGAQAEALLRRRRWASSARSLHRDVAAFARRGDHGSASRSAMALGRVRLSMADAVSALRWFRAAIVHALEASDDGLAAQALAWEGVARVDEAEVEEGERALRCAWMGARHGGERALAEWVRIRLARSLYWQGRFNDMPFAREASVDEDALAVRVEMVRGQLGRAATRLAEGARRVERVQDADAASALDGEAARLHLLIGDLDACDRYLKDALGRRCSRARTLRLYLILHLRLMRDQTAASRRRRERLAQTLLRSDTPRLLRIRARYWIERPSGRWSRELREFIARFGEAALAGGAAPTGGEPMWDDLQGLLRICHEGTDEREALARMCGHVRERIGAARVAVHVAVAGAGLANALPLVHSGSSRLASGTLAHRLLDTGVLAPVSAGPDGLEAGVPVKYGATVLGSIVARWTVGARPDERLVTMVMMTMGAVAAPMLQAFRDRHAGGTEGEASGSGSAAGPETAIGTGIGTGPGTGGRSVASAAGPALLGRSAAIETLRQTIRRVAAAPFHVLVHGESGSGKELVARALHHHSPRRHRRFCAINCAALTDELFEAEMFGHTRGAFTGALVERQGLFEEADGGTLFLDEVGELSARGQAKLLRVMQDGEVRRIGENLSRRVEARIVAATNRVLKEDVRRGQFRADLLYRLDVIHLDVPPLRERREDIPLLARAFWDEAARKVGSRATMAAETVAVLARYDWPGNVRELHNALMALAAQAGPRGRVMPEALVPLLGELAARPGRSKVSFVKARRAFEARLVRAALLRSGGASARAARDLGLTRQGLAKVMTRLGIVAVDGGSG